MTVERPLQGVEHVQYFDHQPLRLDAAMEKLPQVSERPELPTLDSDNSGSSEGSRPDPLQQTDSFEEEVNGHIQFTPGSTFDSPLSPRVGPTFSWTAATPEQDPRSRESSVSTSAAGYDAATAEVAASTTGLGRPLRPSAPARTPSSTYAPIRGPPQYISFQATRNRSNSQSRQHRRDPNAQYRAQEKAYVQRIRQEPAEYFGNNNSNGNNNDNGVYPPSLGYSTGSETGDESPSPEANFDNDPYDQDVPLYYGNDDLQPSLEELKIPENRERLEWHSMLASVLTGDVVKQEKKRLIGGAQQPGENSLKTEIWIGIRAKVCGRTLAAQRRLIDDGRLRLDADIESVVNFEIKGEKEAGKPSAEQVQDVVKTIERCESLYPTRMALEAAKPRTKSQPYQSSCDAVFAWHTTTELINTELAILRSWVGNDELDFGRTKADSPDRLGLSDSSSFLDRILKEDGLKSLQGDHSMLNGVSDVIRKAKNTLIENAEAFAIRHLPPYIEELLTLINFPSRLIGEVIRIRLLYARNMKDPSQQSSIMAEQMILQFQILLKLAVEIKQEYVFISQPQSGWDLPPCLDDNFDVTVVEALKFYFKMLNWKLSGNKNTFKEAEMLEQEWEFSNEIGRHLDGGDVEVAEQFRYGIRHPLWLTTWDVSTDDEI